MSDALEKTCALGTRADGSLPGRALVWLALWLAVWMCGCASYHSNQVRTNRVFQFAKDTFAYPNELVWDYGYDANGRWVAHKHDPEPAYTLHCLVVARSARQFFDHARFDPEQPKADETTYHQLVHRVIAGSPRESWPDDKRVVIPGYANLREFSSAEEVLLKQECGGAWQSYFARGNWRMIFPFTRAQQAKVADSLVERLRPDHPLIVHVSTFPQLTVNHTVLIFGVRQSESEIRFDVYDPNEPERPTNLVFDRKTRNFQLPANHYFPGGSVDVYETFYRWDY